MKKIKPFWYHVFVWLAALVIAIVLVMLVVLAGVTSGKRHI